NLRVQIRSIWAERSYACRRCARPDDGGMIGAVEFANLSEALAEQQYADGLAAFRRATTRTLTRGKAGPGPAAGAVLPVAGSSSEGGTCRFVPQRRRAGLSVRPGPNVVRLGWRPGSARNSPRTAPATRTAAHG